MLWIIWFWNPWFCGLKKICKYRNFCFVYYLHIIIWLRRMPGWKRTNILKKCYLNVAPFSPRGFWTFLVSLAHGGVPCGLIWLNPGNFTRPGHCIALEILTDWELFHTHVIFCKFLFISNSGPLVLVQSFFRVQYSSMVQSNF